MVDVQEITGLIVAILGEVTGWKPYQGSTILNFTGDSNGFLFVWPVDSETLGMGRVVGAGMCTERALQALYGWARARGYKRVRSDKPPHIRKGIERFLEHSGFVRTGNDLEYNLCVEVPVQSKMPV